MKMTRAWSRHWLMALWLMVGLGLASAAQSPTAFELIKEGNKYVGEQAKNQVVQVRSEKSIAGLIPEVWWVVYYDPTATFKAVEVKFAAGKMIDVKRPMRLLEPVTGKHKPMDRNKLKVDSDEALKIALAEPILANVKPASTQFKLENEDIGPVWKIRIWAYKIRESNRIANVGEIHISAEDGKVVKNDLDIKGAD